MEISRNSVVGAFGVIIGSGWRWAFEAFSRYVRGGLGGGRRFELLGEGTGGVPIWIVNMFLGGFMKQMRLPTSSSRSSWSVELQRNLMFATSSGVIVRSESFSLESWEKFL